MFSNFQIFKFSNWLLIACCLLPTAYGFSQSPVFKADRAVAKEFFDSRNYSSALKTYQLLLQNDANNIEYNQKAAQCYLLSNSIKQKAIVHLERIIRQKKYPDDVWLDLGRAYHSANRFDRAIKGYETYKEKQEDKKKETTNT